MYFAMRVHGDPVALSKVVPIQLGTTFFINRFKTERSSLWKVCLNYR